MEPFVATTSRGKMALAFLGSLAFVGTGIALIVLQPEPTIVAVSVIAILFFGVTGIVSARRALQAPRIVVTFDEQGFFDDRVMRRKLPWSDVRSASLREIRRSQFISIDVGSTEPIKQSRLAGLNAAMGFAPLNINPGFLDHPKQEVIDAFFTRLARTGVTSPH